MTTIATGISRLSEPAMETTKLNATAAGAGDIRPSSKRIPPGGRISRAATWSGSRTPTALMTRACSECDKEFTTVLPHKLTCSKRCSYKRGKKVTLATHHERRGLDRECGLCGAEFRAKSVTAIYCSKRCFNYAHALKHKFNLTPDQYREMLANSGGRCEACGEKPIHTLHVDHCHESGHVRGLLCRNCNSALGQLGDDPDRAFGIGLYLARDGFDLRDFCAA